MYAHQVQHNLTQKHVLQRAQCAIVALGTEVLEGLEEVGVGGGIILVFGVEDTGLEVERGLEVGRAVYRIGGGSGGSQGGLWEGRVRMIRRLGARSRKWAMGRGKIWECEREGRSSVGKASGSGGRWTKVRHTFAFAKLPIPRYTRLSRR